MQTGIIWNASRLQEQCLYVGELNLKRSRRMAHTTDVCFGIVFVKQFKDEWSPLYGLVNGVIIIGLDNGLPPV